MAVGIAVAAIISSIIAAAASATAAGINYKNTQDTNAMNARAQAAVNAQQQYNLEHAHQIEMADLQAAGLNPVLTAMGGQGAPMASLQAMRAQTPQVDLSGISTALNSMVHMMMMSQLIDAKMDAAEANANARITSAQIGADARNNVASKYIDSRAGKLYRHGSAGNALINSSRKVSKLEKEFSDKDIDDLDDILEFFKGR